MKNPDSSDNLVRAIVLILAILVLSPLIMMLFAVPMWGMMGTSGGGWMMGSAVSPMWGIGMAVVWLVVLGAIGYALYRGFVGRGGAHEDPVMEELRLAYARGDLSDEEFEERRETLQRDS